MKIDILLSAMFFKGANLVLNEKEKKVRKNKYGAWCNAVLVCDIPSSHAYAMIWSTSLSLAYVMVFGTVLAFA